MNECMYYIKFRAETYFVGGLSVGSLELLEKTKVLQFHCKRVFNSWDMVYHFLFATSNLVRCHKFISHLWNMKS
jgi:hypothetical protein